MTLYVDTRVAYEPFHALPAAPPSFLGETMLMPTVKTATALPPTYEAGSVYDTASLEVAGPHPGRFRDTLRDFGPTDDAKFDGHLAACVTDAVGRHGQLTRKPTDQPWSTWVANNADQSEILGVLMSHNRVVGELNEDPTVERLLDGRRDWVADRLDEAARWGVLNPHMLTVAGRLREKVSIWFGDDVRDVILRKGGAEGYCAPDRSYVVLRQHLEIANPADRREVAVRSIYSNRVPHELLHTGEVAEWLPEWMIEVAVEDITQTIIHGNDTQEALRPLPDRGYPNRREIRQTLLHDGAHRIDDMTYLRAVSSPGMDSIDSQQLWDQLDLSWGVRNTLGFVSRRLIAYETAYLKDAEGTGMTPAEALAHAAFEVNRELTEEPDKVFWPGYQKPQPHMGAAALVGAGQS